MKARLAVALAAAALLTFGAAPGALRPAAAAGASASVQRVNGVPCVAANDLSRLLDAAQFWRADVRKLVLRAGQHRVTLTADNPFVLIDDHTVRLEADVTSLGGQFQVPVSLLPQLPRDSSLARLIVDLQASRVRVAPAAGFVGTPVIRIEDGVARLTLSAERADGATVLSRGRAHLRVRVPGAFAGAAVDSFAPGPLLRAVQLVPGTDATVVDLAAGPDAQGFRLLREDGRVVVELARGGAGLERFAAEAPAGTRVVGVIVIDPGHGGSDTGVHVDQAIEKDLTLALARVLADELTHRTGARVLLTRTDDRDMSQQERAEFANRARADVVLSLHFDGLPGARVRGATAWCAPALYSEGGAGAHAAATGALTPWRDVAMHHAVDSRALADAIAGSLETRGLGPARVRERLPVALLGVNATGLSLECATLTSPEDRARVGTPEGLRELASSIADGVAGYARP